MSESLFDGMDPTRCKCGRLAGSDGLCAFCARPHFDGETYEPEKDHERLTGLLAAVRAHMAFGGWQTLPEIHAALNGQGTEASISARLRDLRKPKFGAYKVERRRRSAGLWEYRLLIPGVDAA